MMARIRREEKIKGQKKGKSKKATKEAQGSRKRRGRKRNIQTLNGLRQKDKAQAGSHKHKHRRSGLGTRAHTKHKHKHNLAQEQDRTRTSSPAVANFREESPPDPRPSTGAARDPELTRNEPAIGYKLQGDGRGYEQWQRLRASQTGPDRPPIAVTSCQVRRVGVVLSDQGVPPGPAAGP
ncbi:hypothetical protein V8C40DRAFT_104027 [Trichoderma camerunense]